MLILIIGLIVGITYPFSLQQALKEDSFDLIKRQQDNFIPYMQDYLDDEDPNSLIQYQHGPRDVGHIFVSTNNIVAGESIPVAVLNKMVSQAESQKVTLKEYQISNSNVTLFYIVRKMTNGYIISYMKDTYTKEMAKKLWMKLFYILIFAIVIALILTAWLTRYLKAPLKALGNQIEEISKLNWKKPFKWNSGDEFQQLSNQFENMRQNLVRYDDSQKQFLQRASHEMKTPIMVIQSYAQSVKDGVYPADDTMDIIMDEAALMEKRVQKLLYYTKVDSLRDERPELKRLIFGPMAESIIARFSGGHPEISMMIEGQEVEIDVDEEQFSIVLENLVENALRYAKSEITLQAKEKEKAREIVVRNDGVPIPEEEKNQLFEPFKKGNKGQFGLGLAIVKRIVERHDGHIEVHNQENGVAFVITLPFKNKQTKS